MSKIVHQFKLHSVHFFTAALSLVVALSWNDTIKAGIDEVYPGDRGRFLAKLIYSLVITLVMVMIITFIFPSNGAVPPSRTEQLSSLKKFLPGYSALVRDYT